MPFACIPFEILTHAHLTRYEADSTAVVVRVYEGRELHVPGKGRGDPYVKVYINPDPKKVSKRKTSIKTKTIDPLWNEELRYPIINVAVSARLSVIA